MSQVSLLQTAHSWANAGVLLGGRMRLGIAFATIKLSDEVCDKSMIVNELIS